MHLVSPGFCSAQELQAEAKVLVERQRQVAAELQQLQTEAENLSEADQQLIQAQLSTEVVLYCQVKVYHSCSREICYLPLCGGSVTSHELSCMAGGC